GFRDFLSLCPAHKLFDERKGKRNGGSQSSAGGNVTVNHYFILQNLGSVQLIHKRRIGRGLSVFQESQPRKNAGRRADRRHFSSFAVKLCEKLCKGGIFSQILRSRHSSRQDQHIRVGEISSFKGPVRVHGDVMRCGDLSGILNGNCLYIDPGPAHQIYHCKAFNIFKSVRQKNIYFAHSFYLLYFMQFHILRSFTFSGNKYSISPPKMVGIIAVFFQLGYTEISAGYHPADLSRPGRRGKEKKDMEIERKFLIDKENLPENLEQFPCRQIEQGYLCTAPVVRIRRQDEEYYLTYKSAGLMAREEYNLPLDREAYLHLKPKADGLVIAKTRYLM